MAIVDLVMPKMGESIMEATILKWNKQPGDFILQDESLLDIATDKVDSEVPSVAAGILKEILFPENSVVPVGAVIARIETNVNISSAPETENPGPESAHHFLNEETSLSRESTVNASSLRSEGQSRQPSSINPSAPVSGGQIRQPQTVNGNANRFYSPLVLNIASNEGIHISELEKITGTGNEGRVTKKDILSYVDNRKNGNGIQTTSSVTDQDYAYAKDSRLKGKVEQGESILQQPEINTGYTGVNVEIREMDRMRKMIAEHMVRSKQTSPHVTSFSEADVTNLVLWRDKEKADFEKREGTKLTLTPLFIEAVIKCIKQFPLINSSLQGDKIVLKKDINIGMATALPSGSLIVPVIKNADNYNRVGLARQVNTLAGNARINKLKPEDIQDGTFTLTNVGVFGSLMGTPIINQPQVAILAVGAIKKRPVVIETDQGDSIGIRHMMYLSMSYDHRIIDGSLGASFLTAVARELEAFQA
jgi:2-oxoglutarate dehydrogenase E2 component (dihydrolipoamide succinyltransferase)